MSLGRSKKPCVGCGKLPSEDRYGSHWTAAKPLCHDCCAAIKAHKKLAALATKRLKGDLQAVTIPYDGDRCWPNHDRGENFNDPKLFREAFLKLCRVLGTPCLDRSENPLVTGQEYTYGEENHLAFEPQVVAALRELFAAVQKLEANAYQEGRSRGANLLNDLLEGSRTAQGINEIVCKDNKG